MLAAAECPMRRVFWASRSRWSQRCFSGQATPSDGDTTTSQHWTVERGLAVVKVPTFLERGVTTCTPSIGHLKRVNVFLCSHIKEDAPRIGCDLANGFFMLGLFPEKTWVKESILCGGKSTPCVLQMILAMVSTVD